MKKILIVENHPAMEKVIKNLVARIYTGDGIETAKEEKVAIDMINNNDFGLIMLDCNNGQNVLYGISKKVWPKIIVISNNEFFLEYCKDKGISAFDKRFLAENQDDLVELMALKLDISLSL